MESIYYEKLKTRDLWVDGESSLNIDGISDKFLSGDLKTFASNKISQNVEKELKKFVSLVFNNDISNIDLKSKIDNAKLDTSFNIPKKYLDMDVQKRIVQGLKTRHNLKDMNTDELDNRLYRIADEIDLFMEMGLYDVLKCITFIIDTFKEKNIVWGPGRGSACCSYVLYLLDVHDIDSFYFDLDVYEFLR